MEAKIEGIAGFSDSGAVTWGAKAAKVTLKLDFVPRSMADLQALYELRVGLVHFIIERAQQALPEEPPAEGEGDGEDPAGE